MNTIKNILIDSLNGFSINDIPLFLFQLLVAGLCAHIFQVLLNKKFKKNILSEGGLIAIVLTLLTGIVKYSLPFAIMGLAAVLLFKSKKERTNIENIALIIVATIGVGCGTGSVVQTILGFVIILGVLLFTPIKNNE
jgi:hypothetical protein